MLMIRKYFKTYSRPSRQPHRHLDLSADFRDLRLGEVPGSTADAIWRCLGRTVKEESISRLCALYEPLKACYLRKKEQY